MPTASGAERWRAGGVPAAIASEGASQPEATSAIVRMGPRNADLALSARTIPSLLRNHSPAAILGWLARWRESLQSLDQLRAHRPGTVAELPLAEPVLDPSLVCLDPDGLQAEVCEVVRAGLHVEHA